MTLCSEFRWSYRWSVSVKHGRGRPEETDLSLSFTFGLLVDIIGRRWAFNLTCLITSVFGMLVVSPR